MGFPREVREMVYELVLCVDGVLAAYKESYTVDNDYEGPLPTVALLATNKQIRSETLPVLFGKNTWRITSAPKKLTFRYKRDGKTDRYHESDVQLSSISAISGTLFSRFGHLLYRVTLDFNFQDIDRTEIVNRVHATRGSYNAVERMQVLHDDSSDLLTKRWLQKQRCFIWISNIRSVVIDITNTYCSFGCCRFEMLERLLGGDNFFNDIRVAYFLGERLKIPSFGFRGTRTEEEEGLAESWQQRLRERVFAQRLLYEARLGIRTSPRSEIMEVGGVSSHMVW